MKVAPSRSSRKATRLPSTHTGCSSSSTSAMTCSRNGVRNGSARRPSTRAACSRNTCNSCRRRAAARSPTPARADGREELRAPRCSPFLMPERFMLLPNRLLCAALTTAMALLAGACASVDVGGAPGPSVPAPQYRVGDKWVYHIVDGYRAKIVWDETHEVTAIGADGVTVKVIAKGPTIDVERVEKWPSPDRKSTRLNSSHL